MALPASRDVTFAPGTQIPSATLNTIQDLLVALKASKTRVFPGTLGVLQDDSGGSGLLDHLTHRNDLTLGLTRWASSGRSLIIPLTMEIGERILRIRTTVQDNAIDSTVLSVFAYRTVDDFSTARFSLGGGSTDGSGNAQVISTPALTESVISGRAYMVVANPTDPQQVFVSHVEVDYDIP